MADFTFRLEGIADLEKKLDTDKKVKAVERAVKQNASEMQQDAIRLAPHRTGYLKATIGAGLKVAGMTATLEPFAHYAAYVELGTRFMGAQPYLHPAWVKASQQLTNDISRIVGE